MLSSKVGTPPQSACSPLGSESHAYPCSPETRTRPPATSSAPGGTHARRRHRSHRPARPPRSSRRCSTRGVPASGDHRDGSLDRARSPTSPPAASPWPSPTTRTRPPSTPRSPAPRTSLLVSSGDVRRPRSGSTATSSTPRSAPASAASSTPSGAEGHDLVACCSWPTTAATEEALAAVGPAHTVLRDGWYVENYTGQVATYLEHGMVGAAGAGTRQHRTAQRTTPRPPRSCSPPTATSARSTSSAARRSPSGELASLIVTETGREITYTDVPVETLAGHPRGRRASPSRSRRCSPTSTAASPTASCSSTRATSRRCSAVRPPRRRSRSRLRSRPDRPSMRDDDGALGRSSSRIDGRSRRRRIGDSNP